MSLCAPLLVLLLLMEILHDLMYQNSMKEFSMCRVMQDLYHQQYVSAWELPRTTLELIVHQIELSVHSDLDGSFMETRLSSVDLLSAPQGPKYPNKR